MVLVVALVWFVWPRGDSTEQAGNERPGAGGNGNGNGDGGGGGKGDDVGVVVPGENPIEHVIFLIKENRSFDHYFGTLPGVEGATKGGTLDCSTCRDSGRVKLKDAPLVQPHDLGHAFYPGLLRSTAGR